MYMVCIRVHSFTIREKSVLIALKMIPLAKPCHSGVCYVCIRAQTVFVAFLSLSFFFIVIASVGVHFQSCVHISQGTTKNVNSKRCTGIDWLNECVFVKKS